MKKEKKLLFLLFISIAMLTATTLVDNVRAESENIKNLYETDATTSYTIVRTYYRENDIPNAIWIEKDGCVCYVYKRNTRTKIDKNGRYYYEVVFSGTLMRGPFIPTNKKEGEKL